MPHVFHLPVGLFLLEKHSKGLKVCFYFVMCVPNLLFAIVFFVVAMLIVVDFSQNSCFAETIDLGLFSPLCRGVVYRFLICYSDMV